MIQFIIVILLVNAWLLARIDEKLSDLRDTMQNWYEKYVRNPEWEDYILEHPIPPERSNSPSMPKH